MFLILSKFLPHIYHIKKYNFITNNILKLTFSMTSKKNNVPKSTNSRNLIGADLFCAANASNRTPSAEPYGYLRNTNSVLPQAEPLINGTTLYSQRGISYWNTQFVPEFYLNQTMTNPYTENVTHLQHFQIWPQNMANMNFCRSFSDSSRFHTNLNNQGLSRQKSEPNISPTKLNTTDFPSIREWEKINTSLNHKPGFFFTLMSYNVLAQELIVEHQHNYVHHSQKHLEWPVRWKNLLKEIKIANPDILCLQEVQKSHLKDYYSDLKSLGYGQVYKRKSGGSLDGCAIYFKTDRFILLETLTVEYNQSQTSSLLLNRNNVAVIAKFALKEKPEKEFIVATTHLLYNPKREDVRLAQTQILLAEIERIAFTGFHRDQRKYYPVIITGDFNSSPDQLVPEFIKNAKVDLSLNLKKYESGLLPAELRITDSSQHADLLNLRQSGRHVSRSEEQNIIQLNKSKINITTSYDKSLFSSGHISHVFSFRSVYDPKRKNEILGTTYHEKWKIVDYIFYSGKEKKQGDLKLLERYSLPTAAQMKKVFIPNQNIGSDHVSLIAKFKFQY